MTLRLDSPERSRLLESWDKATDWVDQLPRHALLVAGVGALIGAVGYWVEHGAGVQAAFALVVGVGLVVGWWRGDE